MLSGAFIGNNNTLITGAVMGAAPVERPVASAAYSFVRFCGGAVGPYVALKLFGLPPTTTSTRRSGSGRSRWHGRRHPPGRCPHRVAALAHDHETCPSSRDAAEAEAVLVGDID